MKDSTTILLVVGEDIIARNILQTDFWPLFTASAKKHQWHVVCVVSPKSQAGVTALVGADATCVVYERAAPSRVESLIMTLARSGISTHTNLWSKMRSYLRGDSTRISTYAKRFHTYVLGRSTLYKRFLRWSISQLPSDPHASALFERIRPDVCIPLSLGHFDFDVPLAREARKRGIPLLGMVRSWDNLSSHGLLRVVPDVFFLQNIFLKDMAIAHQAIDVTRTPVHIVGLPHYDGYAHADDSIIPRDEWCRLLGLDPHKKVILYGAMGEFLFKTENHMPEVLNQAVIDAGLTEEVQVLFRSHPRFVPNLEGVTLPHVSLHIPDSYTDTTSGYSNESILLSSIIHATFVVTGASTMAVDALILKRSVLCVGFDPVPSSYWESVGRFFDTYTHFEAFIAASQVPVVRSREELAQQFQRLIAHPAYDEASRARTIALLAAPFGESGKRLAMLMEKEIIRISHE